MAAIGFNSAQVQLFDNNGDPLVGGKVNVYIAGSSTRQDTYFDADLAVGHKNANPVILDSAGRAVIYFTPTPALKIVVTDTNNVGVWSQDGVSPAAVAT